MPCVDVTAPLASNRERLWQETTTFFQAGAFGNPTELETLVEYWRKMEVLHYPGAGETRKNLMERLERQREQAQLQAEIEEAEQDFHRCCAPLLDEPPIDVCFFPVDPRQGSMFEAGADYFILAVKPRLMIPMHYFHRTEIISEYARVASCRTTEVLAMPGIRDSILLTFDDDGYLNISFPSAVEEKKEEEPLEKLDGDNPFFESDLPLAQLAENDEEPEDSATKSTNLST